MNNMLNEKSNTHKNRKEPYILPLCDEISVHYTCYTITSKTRYKDSGGKASEAHFSLYSKELKKQIGVTCKIVYPCTKNQLELPNNEKVPLTIPKKYLNEGLERLLFKNVGISLTHRKNSKSITLNENKLAVYFVSHFNIFDAAYWQDEVQCREIFGRFARMACTIGDFDLSRFLVSDLHQVDIACTELATLVRQSNGRSDNNSVSWTSSRPIYVMLRHYLESNGVDWQNACECFSSKLRVKAKSTLHIAQNMRRKSLSLNEYNALWTKLSSTKYPEGLSRGLLLMLFLGVSAEEMSALCFTDIKPLSGYSGRYVVEIRKENVEQGKRLLVSNALDNNSGYRTIPLPQAFAKFFNVRAKRQSNEPIACDDKDSSRSIRPSVLKTELATLIETDDENSVLAQSDKGVIKKIDLSFDYKNYVQSCRHFWRYVCGLSDGEVRFLAGLAPNDTASKHYIDYFNSHKQLHMLLQMSYGLSLVIQSDLSIKTTQMLPISTSAGAVKFASGLRRKTHLRLIVKEPLTCVLSSYFGMNIVIDDEGEL